MATHPLLRSLARQCNSLTVAATLLLGGAGVCILQAGPVDRVSLGSLSLLSVILIALLTSNGGGTPPTGAISVYSLLRVKNNKTSKSATVDRDFNGELSAIKNLGGRDDRISKHRSQFRPTNPYFGVSEQDLADLNRTAPDSRMDLDRQADWTC
ncbi:MAG: hypothetical protein JNJ88_21055 [Planctomycetes bacterium]|nr:hypothetical protein [Planctomycetota bacterium]